MSGTIRLGDVPAIPDMSITEEQVLTELALRNGDPANSWAPINLNQLPETPPQPPTLGNINLVYPGKRHVFSGPQESAKTLAAYTIAIQLARQDQETIIIDFEMGRYDARNRLRELGATPDQIDRIHYLEPWQPATSAHIEALITLHPQLVIIDAAAGAYDLQSLDDNKRTDVERFTSIYIRAFWRNEIATIVLDHVVKNIDNRGAYAIGSERKVGGADVHLGFAPITPISRGGKGHYKITTHKDRGGYLRRGRVADLHLDSDPDTNNITWEYRPYEPGTDDEGHWRPTVLMKTAYDHIAANPGSSKTEVYDAMTSKRRELKVQAVGYLISDGFVTDQGEEGRSHLVPVKTYDPDHDTDGGNGMDSTFPSTDTAESQQTRIPNTNPGTRSPDSRIPTTFPDVPDSQHEESFPRSHPLGGNGNDLPNTRNDIDVYDPKIQRQLDDDIPF